MRIFSQRCNKIYEKNYVKVLLFLGKNDSYHLLINWLFYHFQKMINEWKAMIGQGKMLGKNRTEMGHFNVRLTKWHVKWRYRNSNSNSNRRRDVSQNEGGDKVTGNSSSIKFCYLVICERTYRLMNCSIIGIDWYQISSHYWWGKGRKH